MMRCSGLLILGLLLNVAQGLETLGPPEDPDVEVAQRNVTAVLGEVVYLSCTYLRQSQVLSAKWRRQIAPNFKSKALAGFANGRTFNGSGFSDPESLTNLTVQMEVSSVDAEGEYVCEFESEEGDFSDRVFVTVVARPQLQIHVSSETINGTQYQSVTCTAAAARPAPLITWSLGDAAPSGHAFTVSAEGVAHSNGTFTQSSVLRFPTHLQDEEAVTCKVQHPTLPQTHLTTVRVETYARPNVTISAEMVQRQGNSLWVVSCISSGGRPDADISLALSGGEEPQRENRTDSGEQRSSVSLPAAAYEGRNVTCRFDHPKFTRQESRTVTLPTFHLTEARLLEPERRNNSGSGSEEAEGLTLQEGQSDVIIGMAVVGNVPWYNVTCRKDSGPLPEAVALLGSNLTVQGPVELQHAGLYHCVYSYQRLRAALHINITVQPKVIPPVAPNIQVGLQTIGGRRLIECSATDAVPAANVSWLLPEGVSGVSWSNFTFGNESHSVRGVLLLPACSPRELTAECVINHLAFEKPQNRSIMLPLCARTNVTMTSDTRWRDGELFTQVRCRAASAASAAVIAWFVGDRSIAGNRSEPEVLAEGSVSVHSSVLFPSSMHAGQNLTCAVLHPSLEAAETRTIHIPVLRAPRLGVSVVQLRDSRLWMTVCESREEAGGTNLTWVLPENARGQTSVRSEYEGRSLRVRLTYRFPLALHEGQDLTCVCRFRQGPAQNRTVHIPLYHIAALRVLNRTTPLVTRYGGETVALRLALQENRLDQNILLRVEGNVPQYELSCTRSDGSPVHTDGPAVVFRSALTEKDGGLITCRASFYHHTATVKILVEVARENGQTALVAMICVSSASAFIVVLLVTLWVCRSRNIKTHSKKEECLSALMQAHRSPEVITMEKEGKETAQLINFSIIIDEKSRV